MVGGLWSIGSFNEHITNIVGPTNVPTSVSGATMDNIIWQQIAVVENFIGININDDAVEETYQPTISNLATAQIFSIIDAVDITVHSASIDDLKITNQKQSFSEASNTFKQLGMDMLEQLTRRPRFKKVWGV